MELEPNPIFVRKSPIIVYMVDLQESVDMLVASIGKLKHILYIA